jgi:hypothetical protein
MDTVTFIVGMFVTLLVLGSIGMLIWAGVEDGKRQLVKEQDLKEAALMDIKENSASDHS